MAGSQQNTPVFTRLRPHHRTPDLTGQVFGRLTVLEFAGGDGRKGWWKARCSCGTEKLFVGSELRKGRTNSCGCLAAEVASRRATTHGMSRHPVYAVWSGMLDRCELKSHFAYPRYGGRGITVCERWHRFEAFWEDMGPTYQRGLTLERKDNNAGYSPENCEWATRRAQARNTRQNRTVDTPDGRMLLCEASELTGIGMTTLEYRLDHDWPTEMLFIPPDFTNRVT